MSIEDPNTLEQSEQPELPTVPDITEEILHPENQQAEAAAPSEPSAPVDPRDANFRDDSYAPDSVESVQAQIPVIETLSQEDSEGRQKDNAKKLDALQPLAGKPI